MTPYALPLSAAPAMLGFVVSQLTELVTASSAPAPLKRAVCLALSSLAGAAATVTIDAHSSWTTYAAAIASAWIGAIATHASGLTQATQNVTADFGLGRNSTDETQTGSSMLAGLDFSGAHIDPADVAPGLSDLEE